MKQFLGALTFAALMAGSTLVAQAQDVVTLSVAHPYTYATTEKQPNAAVFFEVTNTGSEDVTITGAETTIGKEASLHTMSKDGDIMKMRPVNSFTIKPAEALTLSPHGDHIMIMDVAEPLNVGDNIELVLKTTQGDLPVQALVIKPGTDVQDHTFHHDAPKHPTITPAQPSEEAADTDDHSHH